MKMAKKLPYPCRCGGPLVEAPIHIEHLGIHRGTTVSLVPSGKGKLEIEVV